MRSGEGFLLVYSVTDKARYVNCTKQYMYMRSGEGFLLCALLQAGQGMIKKIKTKKQKTKRRREVHGNIFFFLRVYECVGVGGRWGIAVWLLKNKFYIVQCVVT